MEQLPPFVMHVDGMSARGRSVDNYPIRPEERRAEPHTQVAIIRLVEVEFL
jgi:hypothetical protein